MYRPSVWLGVFTLAGLIALAKGAVNQPAASKVLSEAELPAEPNIWSGCCSHYDCREARVTTYEHSEPDKAMVVIDHYDPFPLERSKIHPSKDGRDYFCRRNLNLPPDSENTRCVFLGKPRYVHAK